MLILHDLSKVESDLILLRSPLETSPETSSLNLPMLLVPKATPWTTKKKQPLDKEKYLSTLHKFGKVELKSTLTLSLNPPPVTSL